MEKIEIDLSCLRKKTSPFREGMNCAKWTR